MEVKHAGGGPRTEILKALASMKKKYQYRTAKGLAKQTGLPMEHVEHYLILLAQKGKIMVLVSEDGEILAHGFDDES